MPKHGPKGDPHMMKKMPKGMMPKVKKRKAKRKGK